MNEKRPFLCIHNLFVWVYFHSSTTSGMGLFLFIHNLWNRSLFIHPEPLVWSLVVNELKETYSGGCG
jgi:hypothetical protein